jgi:hypothetical protein
VSALRIVVSGMVAGDPDQGGATWAVLQYVLGLRRLGHDVLLVEPVDELTPRRVAAFEALQDEFGLRDSSALLAAGGRRTVGLPYPAVSRRCRDADLLLNVSGMLGDPELVAPIPVRVYLDLDPAFNQLWEAAAGIDMRFGGHTHFASVGLALGSRGCSVPTGGRDWIRTLPPVVLEHWRPAGVPTRHAFTTVGNWRAYGSIEHEGRHYGQKAHSLRGLVGLPLASPHRFEVALAIHRDEGSDLDALKANGWRLLDAGRLTGTPTAYRDFVRGSQAEIGIAKAGYVESRCGWFSDRSACYLAAGRPVLAQDTGFGDALPTGEGLLVFTDERDAAAAADAVLDDYERHSRAARELAEEHLDSNRVLERLLERVGGTA